MRKKTPLPLAGMHLADEHQVADLLAVSVKSVRRWRLLKTGPPFRKIGPAVRYDTGELNEWLKSRPGGGERKAG